MKRIFLLILITIFSAVSLLFVSCDTIEDIILGPRNAPTIDFRYRVGASGDFVNATRGGEIAITRDDAVHVEVAYKASGEIKSIDFKLGDTPENITSFQTDTTHTFAKRFDFNTVGNFIFTTEIKDKQDPERNADFTFTVKVEPRCVYSVSDPPTNLGGQSTTAFGSFYSVQNRQVLFIAGANASPATIDFIYFHSGGATIASPNDAESSSTFSSVSSWSTRNNTRFLILPDARHGDPSEWWDDFVEGIDGRTTSTKVSGLDVGDIITFRTASGTKGAFVIDDIISGTLGNISIRFIGRSCQ